jgi:hypothetical protein
MSCGSVGRTRRADRPNTIDEGAQQDMRKRNRRRRPSPAPATRFLSWRRASRARSSCGAPTAPAARSVAEEIGDVGQPAGASQSTRWRQRGAAPPHHRIKSPARNVRARARLDPSTDTGPFLPSAAADVSTPFLESQWAVRPPVGGRLRTSRGDCSAVGGSAHGVSPAAFPGSAMNTETLVS